MNQSMSMYETTRYQDNTTKKRVVNLVVPTHLTKCTIKLPETLRLDKVTDVYLDGITDMAGETTECFEQPSDQTDGSIISVKKNNRNFGMDGNKEDNSQLMIIKIDELEMKNIAATPSVIEEEDENVMNNANVTNPNNIPKFFHKRADGIFGTNHVNNSTITSVQENTDKGEWGSRNTVFLSTVSSSGIGINRGYPPQLNLEDPYLRATNTRQFNTDAQTGVHQGSLPAVAQDYDFEARENPESELLEALRAYYEYTVSRYERYRWFIYVTAHGPPPPNTNDIKYDPSGVNASPHVDDTSPTLEDELAIISPQKAVDGGFNQPVAADFKLREAVYNEVLIGREIYFALLKRYQEFRRIEREWYERVQRFEYSMLVSSTMNNSIVVPNTKSTRISDEFVQNYPIRGDDNNFTNRLTPFQLSTYNVSRYNSGLLDPSRPFSFSQSEYTVNKSERGIRIPEGDNIGDWVIRPDEVSSNRDTNNNMSVRGYDKRGVHSHRLNKFNFISTINPKSIDSFNINYGFLKTRILGVGHEDILGKISPVWDISQGRPLGHDDYNYIDGNVDAPDTVQTVSIFRTHGDPLQIESAPLPVFNHSQYVPESVREGGTRKRNLGVTDEPPIKEWIGWGNGVPGALNDLSSRNESQNYWENLNRNFSKDSKSELTYSKEKYPGWKQYRGGVIRPLSYDNPLNKYDDSLDTRDPVELSGRVAANHNAEAATSSEGQGVYNPARSTPANFGIAEPNMRYSSDIGRLSITLVFIERD